MSRKVALFVASLCVITIPFAIGQFLLWDRYDASLLDAAPFWSDELYHWHQSATFSVAGFNGGFYTLDEIPARLDTFRFYAWGPFSYVIYGIIGAVLGFVLESYTLINAVVFALAIAVYIAIIRPDGRQLALLGVTLACFPPLLFYLPSIMQQVMFLGIAAVIAAGFARLFNNALSKTQITALALFIVIASLLRPTWAVLLLPLIVLARERRGLRQLIEAALVAGSIVIALSALFFVSAADFPHYRSGFISGEAGGLLATISSLLDYFAFNLSIVFSAGSTVAIGQRLQIYLLIALSLCVGVVLLWREWRGDDKHRTRLWEVAFHLFNLGGLALLSMTLHEIIDGRDYRVMAPHLFLSLLLLIAMRRWVVSIIMTLSLLALYVPALDGNALQQYDEWTQPRYNGIVREQYAQWQPLLEENLSYDPEATNPWCNTLVSSFYYVIPFAGDAGLIVAVPPGIGLSWAYTWVSEDFPTPARFQVPQQFKSRWLMLTDDDAAAWEARLNVREIVRVQNGALYENLDADCEDNE